MKLFLLLAASVMIARASNPALNDVKAVYILPMSNGLDQYLAIRLTTGSTVQVVTDAQKADAILTDRIGAGFEQKLDELYRDKSKKDTAKDSSKDSSGSVQEDNAKPVMQPLSRSKGTIFLVDRKTRNVLWSTYALPKSAAPDDMNRLADHIAARLEKDRKGKPAQ